MQSANAPVTHAICIRKGDHELAAEAQDVDQVEGSRGLSVDADADADADADEVDADADADPEGETEADADAELLEAVDTAEANNATDDEWMKEDA